MKEKPVETVRLDKWLWAARIYKTRALAREMIEGGKVHYNGQRSKPGKSSS
jgi:ribosome-associated heat shock protein Hsp15